MRDVAEDIRMRVVYHEVGKLALTEGANGVVYADRASTVASCSTQDLINKRQRYESVYRFGVWNIPCTSYGVKPPAAKKLASA